MAPILGVNTVHSVEEKETIVVLVEVTRKRRPYKAILPKDGTSVELELFLQQVRATMRARMGLPGG